MNRDRPRPGDLRPGQLLLVCGTLFLVLDCTAHPVDPSTLWLKHTLTTMLLSGSDRGKLVVECLVSHLELDRISMVIDPGLRTSCFLLTKETW